MITGDSVTKAPHDPKAELACNGRVRISRLLTRISTFASVRLKDGNHIIKLCGLPAPRSPPVASVDIKCQCVNLVIFDVLNAINV